jgi:hypothetical protein
MKRRGGGLFAAALLCGAWIGGGCAPRVPQPELTHGAWRELYVSELDRRAAQASALEADVALWLRRSRERGEPGVLGRLTLGAPDRFRLRISGVFGTALDVGGSGERVVAVLPARRAYFEPRDLGDSLGVPPIGPLVVRFAVALWRPPAQAWEDATWSTDHCALRWSEGGANVRMDVDHAGEPSRVRLASDSLRAFEVRYSEWSEAHGTRWPGQIEIEDSLATVRLTCRVARVKTQSVGDSTRLTVSVPSGARPLDWSEVSRMIQKGERR